MSGQSVGPERTFTYRSGHDHGPNHAHGFVLLTEVAVGPRRAELMLERRVIGEHAGVERQGGRRMRRVLAVLGLRRIADDAVRHDAAIAPSHRVARRDSEL